MLGIAAKHPVENAPQRGQVRIEMFSGVSARSARFRSLYSSVDYIKAEDVSSLQEAAGLALVRDEATAARDLQDLFVRSLAGAVRAEDDMSPSKVVEAARRISAAARSLLEALDLPADPAEYTGERDYRPGLYPGPTAETLLLTRATTAYYDSALRARLNPDDTTASPPLATDIPSIVAAAARHPFFRRKGQTLLNISSQNSKDIGLAYLTSEGMIEVSPYFIAIILSVSEDLKHSPQIAAPLGAVGPAKRNFARDFRRTFFINAAFTYSQMFRGRPSTADAKREPDGPATRWVIRLIHLGWERFSSALPFLLQSRTADDRRWLNLARTALRGTHQLTPAVKASHLDKSWKKLEAMFQESTC